MKPDCERPARSRSRPLIGSALPYHLALACGCIEPGSVPLGGAIYRPSSKAARFPFVLPTGENISGKVLSVDADALRIKVSGRERVIPAKDLRIMRVNRTTKRWRIICTAAMPVIVVGAIAAAWHDLLESNTSDAAKVAGGVWASLGGGYLLGWALDRKFTEIEIVQP